MYPKFDILFKIGTLMDISSEALVLDDLALQRGPDGKALLLQ